MLYGLSLLYGMTGTTSLPVIRDVLAAGAADANRLPLFVVALLVFAGLRLQDRVGALPLLVPRRLPGRAHRR